MTIAMNETKQELYDKVFLNVAREMASLSHCVKTAVAAVAVKDGRILATGINGTSPGVHNCDEVFDRDNFDAIDNALHREWADDNEIHAEMNLILFAARHGISLDGATMYVTMQACKQCTKNIPSAGIKRVVYSSLYSRISAEEKNALDDYFIKRGVEVLYKPQ